MIRLQQWIRKYPTRSFIFLNYAISWFIWIPLVLKSWNLSTWELPAHHFWGALGPISSALLVTYITQGQNGIQKLFFQGLSLRVSIFWNLIGLSFPLIVLLLALGIFGIQTGFWPDLRQLGPSKEFPEFTLLGSILFHTLTFGLGEEVGWRGFMLPRYQLHFSALKSANIVSFYWALWHIPAFFYRPGYASMDFYEIFGWYLSLWTGSILLTWLFNSSRGNVVAVSLFHATIDVAFTSKIALDPISSYMGGFLIFFGFLIILIYGPKNLSSAPKQVL